MDTTPNDQAHELAAEHHVIPYRTYVNVWLALIGLTISILGITGVLKYHLGG